MDLPVVKHNIDRLNNTELAPFKALMDKNVGGVMVAHLYVPALETKSGIPASVSYSIITDLLKKKIRVQRTYYYRCSEYGCCSQQI